MKYCLEPPSAYFVHVPKTGGISLGALLEVNFKHGDYVKLKPPTLAQLTPADLKRFRCYHSMHQGRGMLDMMGRSDLTCITMVRDPVERSVSQILYLQRTVARIPETFTATYLAQVEPIMHADLSEYLDHAAFVSACDSQIRTLGILEDYIPLFKGSEDAASGRSVLRPYHLPPLMDTENKAMLLDNARRWLGEMAVVGIHEYYVESILLMCDALGISAPTTLPRRNVNPRRTDLTLRYRTQLSPKVVAQIEELTYHDQQLYDEACELFREQWAVYQARPRHRIFSIAPRLRQAVPQVRRVLRPVKQFFRKVFPRLHP
jgi:Sulfotransferase family